jgi:hypothetical protein
MKYKIVTIVGSLITGITSLLGAVWSSTDATRAGLFSIFLVSFLAFAVTLFSIE